jgi:hypothetical protein
MHRTVRPEFRAAWWSFQLPTCRKATLVAVSGGNAADLCVTDPGYEVDLFLLADVRTMTAI